MDLEDAEHFVRVAERDYDVMVQVYSALVREAIATRVEEVREARADVLAAQQVLELARSEEWRARQDQEWEQGMAKMEREREEGRQRILQRTEEKER
jgi:uncharacterized membrane protein YgaE (UPF0421/DUF939 family)